MVSLLMILLFVHLSVIIYVNSFDLSINWNITNEMNFSINKCTTLVVRSKKSIFLNRLYLTFFFFFFFFFFLVGEPLPNAKYYTYLGIPFENDLKLDKIVSTMNTKVRNVTTWPHGFLKNRHIPTVFKRLSRLSF